MTDQQGGDQQAAADMALIEALANGLQLQRWPGDPDTIVELGDLEVTSLLGRRPGGYTFETRDRGTRSIKAVFSTERDARRYLIMDLCEEYRFHWSMPPMVMKRLAAGCHLEDGPTGHRLTWPGGEATFHDRSEALIFSWAIDADPETVLASYQHVNGLPLFDLGIPVDEWNLHRRRRPSGRVMEPAVETPPPDAEDTADQLAIDAVLADLRWQRRPPSGADVLAVADRYQGRAIAYRQCQFVYESTSPSGHRATKATFSTAAAARRFMLIELREVFRGKAGMPRIASDRLAPHCAIEEGPTGFELTWADGRATFPIGDRGHQQALTFSVVVTAELAEVAASCRHPNGSRCSVRARLDGPPRPPLSCRAVSDITVLGLDNVLLDVGDLQIAKGFYGGRLGLGVKFDFPDAGVVGFRLGDEEAGLVVRAGDVPPGPPRPSPRLWLEVPDARAAGKALAAAGVALLGEPRELRTGWLVEVADPWGNVVGLTDYLLAPERARQREDGHPRP